MRRLDEIYNASCKRFEDEIGVNPSENPQSVMNVLFTIFSDAPAEMWEAFAASYQQLFPNTAEGIALDNATNIANEYIYRIFLSGKKVCSTDERCILHRRSKAVYAG